MGSVARLEMMRVVGVTKGIHEVGKQLRTPYTSGLGNNSKHKSLGANGSLASGSYPGLVAILFNSV